MHRKFGLCPNIPNADSRKYPGVCCVFSSAAPRRESGRERWAAMDCAGDWLLPVDGLLLWGGKATLLPESGVWSAWECCTNELRSKHNLSLQPHKRSGNLIAGTPVWVFNDFHCCGIPLSGKQD